MSDFHEFCSVPLNIESMENGHLRKWNQDVVTWRVDEVPEEFHRDDYEAIIQSGFDEISQNCGFRSRQVSRNEFSNLIYLTKRVDGPGRTLAYAELPSSNSGARDIRRCTMDTSENWSHHSGGASGRAMPVRRVILHETLHLLGIGHENTREPALMDPTVSNIRNLQKWDIQQLQARYGKPGIIPAPEPGNECDIQELMKSMSAYEFFKAFN